MTMDKTLDSKSSDRKIVWVRAPPPAPPRSGLYFAEYLSHFTNSPENRKLVLFSDSRQAASIKRACSFIVAAEPLQRLRDMRATIAEKSAFAISIALRGLPLRVRRQASFHVRLTVRRQ